MTAPGPLPPGFLDGLRAAVGAAGVRLGTTLTLDPGVNPANFAAGVVVLPRETAEVAEVLRRCRAAGVAVVPQGGRTGLAGGAISRPGEIVLALERMNRILAVDPDGRTATVEAGVTLERLDQALASDGLAAGIDLGARGSATIGGMVSTNAGGIDAFRYGTMRERVLGLEAVLADGTVLTELSRVRKDNAGLPLRQLFIGAEGTLGVITRVVLALVARSGPRHAALALVPGLEAAVRVMRALEARPGISLAAAELMSGNHVALTARALGIGQVAAAPAAAYAVLFAVTGHGTTSPAEALEAVLLEASEAGLLIDAIVPKNATEERDLWRIREDWAVDRERPGGLWYDVSVPVAALERYLGSLTERLFARDPGLEIYLVGHLADGNVHLTVNSTRSVAARYAEIAPLVYDGLKALGGSFSAEHGIGLEKVAALEGWAGPGLALMRAVKGVFDPAGILNPGKVMRAESLPGAPADPLGSSPPRDGVRPH